MGFHSASGKQPLSRSSTFSRQYVSAPLPIIADVNCSGATNACQSSMVCSADCSIYVRSLA